VIKTQGLASAMHAMMQSCKQGDSLSPVNPGQSADLPSPSPLLPFSPSLLLFAHGDMSLLHSPPHSTRLAAWALLQLCIMCIVCVRCIVCIMLCNFLMNGMGYSTNVLESASSKAKQEALRLASRACHRITYLARLQA
jgi:hypothetical protein